MYEAKSHDQKQSELYYFEFKIARALPNSGGSGHVCVRANILCALALFIY